MDNARLHSLEQRVGTLESKSDSTSKRPEYVVGCNTVCYVSRSGSGYFTGCWFEYVYAICQMRGYQNSVMATIIDNDYITITQTNTSQNPNYPNITITTKQQCTHTKYDGTLYPVVEEWSAGTTVSFSMLNNEQQAWIFNES